MISEIVFTAVQSRILLALFLEGSIGTTSLLNSVGISGKTWSREREKLEASGLLTSREEKRFSRSGVKVVKSHELTEKGTQIARSIKEISNFMNSVS
jgi:predicted transcriptional regulator